MDNNISCSLLLHFYQQNCKNANSYFCSYVKEQLRRCYAIHRV